MTAERRRRISLFVAGALALVLAPDCDGGAGAPLGPDGGDAGIAAAGVHIEATTWRFRWNRDGVAPRPGGGFVVTSDRGYRVEVQSGHFTVHSVSLGPCAPAPPPDLGAWRFPVRLGVRAAFAHEDKDPSSLELALDEDLANPADQGDFRVVFPAVAYCRAHWLVAIPGSGPGGLGPDVAQTSLQIKGTWSRGPARGELDVRTWWPEGRLVDIAAVTDPAALARAQSDRQPRRALVTVERRLGGLFDAIDFATAGPDQVAGQLLANLVGTSTLRVDLDR